MPNDRRNNVFARETYRARWSYDQARANIRRIRLAMAATRSGYRWPPRT